MNLKRSKIDTPKLLGPTLLKLGVYNLFEIVCMPLEAIKNGMLFFRLADGQTQPGKALVPCSALSRNPVRQVSLIARGKM